MLQQRLAEFDDAMDVGGADPRVGDLHRRFDHRQGHALGPVAEQREVALLDGVQSVAEVGKVVFDLKLEMPTSARRFAAEGLWRTAFAYASSFVSEVVLKRPVIDRYRDIR